jgi:TonB family protein
MTRLFLLFLLLTQLQIISFATAETDLENWVDSVFEANELNWAETQKEFYQFARLNFVGKVELEDILEDIVLRENQSKSIKAKKAGRFYHLTQFADFGFIGLHDGLAEELQKLIRENQFMWRKTSMSELLMVDTELAYWSLKTYDITTLAYKLLRLNDGLRVPSLKKKLITLILIDKLYADEDVVPRANIAISYYGKISVDTICPEENVEHDSLVPTISASFIGGEANMRQFIADNLWYPMEAREQLITGKVIISFVVDKEGKLSNIKVCESPNILLSKEAARLIKMMPKWAPGSKNGEAVNMRFSLPLVFKLE